MLPIFPEGQEKYRKVEYTLDGRIGKYRNTIFFAKSPSLLAG